LILCLLGGSVGAVLSWLCAYVYVVVLGGSLVFVGRVLPVGTLGGAAVGFVVGLLWTKP